MLCVRVRRCTSSEALHGNHWLIENKGEGFSLINSKDPTPGIPRAGSFCVFRCCFPDVVWEEWISSFLAFVKRFACFRRASPVERKTNSSQLAFLGNAVGAKGTVCPRPHRRSAKRRCVPREVLRGYRVPVSGRVTGNWSTPHSPGCSGKGQTHRPKPPGSRAPPASR